jgi:toxin ParE1/3/4
MSSSIGCAGKYRKNSALKKCVAKPPKKHDVRLTIPAQRDLSGVMEWTVNEFGGQAALRYDALIKQALKDIGADPERPGSKESPEIMIEGARTYHLEFSRSRVSGSKVKAPRHFLLYRLRGDGVVEVARILHDSSDLTRHLPEQYRRLDTDEE